MDEFWNVYDRYRNKTGKIIKRNSSERLQLGEYHLVTTAVITNNNKILISRRNPNKELYPNLWECAGGSVIVGENSLMAAIREVYEEIGITLKAEEGKLLGTVQQNDYFRDVWKFIKDIDLDSLNFNDGEVTEAKWVTEKEYMQMFLNQKIIPTGECIINLLKKERECGR